MKIFEDGLKVLEQALEVRGQRHTVLASNLANADTPGVAPSDIDFAAAMASELEGDAAAGVGAGGVRSLVAETSEALSGAAGLDGNTVDVDKTMAALAENGMQYGAAAKAAAKKLAMLRYVASDGVG